MLKDLIIKNRSYRGYDENYVMTRDDLLELVDAARLSGSATNRQMLKFHIVYDRETVKQITPLTRWGNLLPDRDLPDPGKGPSAYIVICADERIAPNGGGKWGGYDIGIACQSMLLSAAEKGLGGLMIGSFKIPELTSLLGLAPYLKPQLVVAFGKPAEDVRIVDCPEGGSTKYYRDENDVHYVPKRLLSDIVIE